MISCKLYPSSQLNMDSQDRRRGMEKIRETVDREPLGGQIGIGYQTTGAMGECPSLLLLCFGWIFWILRFQISRYPDFQVPTNLCLSAILHMHDQLPNSIQCLGSDDIMSQLATLAAIHLWWAMRYKACQYIFFQGMVELR